MVESCRIGGSGVALNIKNARTESLAHQVARETGETLTQAVTRALEERLERSGDRAILSAAWPRDQRFLSWRSDTFQIATSPSPASEARFFHPH